MGGRGVITIRSHLDSFRNGNYYQGVADELEHPLHPAQVQKIILHCLDGDGTLVFTQHALDELAADDMVERDAKRVMRGGIKSFDSERHGTYRYKCDTNSACVVIAFDSATATIVVTAWRKT